MEKGVFGGDQVGFGREGGPHHEGVDDPEALVVDLHRKGLALAERVDHIAVLLLGVAIEQGIAQHLQLAAVGLDLGEAQGRLVEVDAIDIDIERLAGGRGDPGASRDPQGGDCRHPIHTEHLIKATARKILQRAQVAVFRDHHHQIGLELLDRLLLAVVEAVQQAQLEEHQQVGEAHPGDADQQLGGVVAHLQPGDRGALQQFLNGTPHQGVLGGWPFPGRALGGAPGPVGVAGAAGAPAPDPA